MVKPVNLLPKGICSNPRKIVENKNFQQSIGKALQTNEKNLHKILVKISKSQIIEAEKMSNLDSAKYFFKLITKEMKIPQELCPKFIIEELAQDAPKLCACYSWEDNVLTYFSKAPTNQNRGKWWAFGLIRHELEHFRQNIDIFANKNTFNELVKFYENIGIKHNVPKSEIENAKKLLLKNREKVLKYYKETDKHSKNYKKTKSYLDSILNYNSYNYKNIKGMFKYFLQASEFDACKAQGLNWINYFKSKILG